MKHTKMETLTYSLEARGDVPIYLYLYECIKRDILSGKLASGTHLPSKRALSAHLGIAVITIENAYAQLVMEGYVIALEKRGYYVAEGVSEGASEVWTNIKTPQINESLPITSKLHKGRKPEAEPIYDFTSNIGLADSFPFASWAKIMRQILLDREESFQKVPPNKGIPELRKAIAEYLYENKGMQVEPERIIVGPGTEYLHHIIIQLLGRNRFVAVEDPGYKKVGRIYEANGVKVLHIPVDEKGLIVSALEGSNVRLVHISPAHHFPTGSVMSVGRRTRLLKWAHEQETYIIEDDYDSEFRFSGRPPATLFSMADESVIYMNTFTKTLAPSIRIAYMVLPERLHEIYLNKMNFYSGTVSAFEQYTLADFISGGYYERHIRRTKNRFRGYRDNLLRAIEESGLSDLVKIHEDKAGLHVILEITGKKNAALLARELELKNIKIRLMEDYCYNRSSEYDKHYEKMFILNYVNIDYDILKTIMEKITENLKKSL